VIVPDRVDEIGARPLPGVAVVLREERGDQRMCGSQVHRPQRLVGARADCCRPCRHRRLESTGATSGRAVAGRHDRRQRLIDRQRSRILPGPLAIARHHERRDDGVRAERS
jgi:hypothetical protein